MEEKTGPKALNVVIERLSEICSKPDDAPGTDDVDNRSVASQTPTVSVVAITVNTPQSRNTHLSPNTSPQTKELFKCKECDYSSHNKHYLKQHVDLVHSTDRPFKCPFCDYAGKRSQALKEHLIVHSNDRPFECTHCNATFRKKGHLTNHIKMHASQWNYDCAICHTAFPTRDALYEHVGKHANDDGDVFACEQCLFATLDKTLIVQHIESGACPGNAKTFKCDICSFTASKEQELSDHKATHAIEFSKQSLSLLLKCSECGFTSTEQEVLENHILNRHLNNRLPIASLSTLTSTNPYDPPEIFKKKYMQPLIPTKSKCVCNICGMTSDDAQGLEQHMTTHAAQQPNPKQIIPKAGHQPNPKQVIPNQSENNCLNPESARFFYDSSLRIFRCSICGYTCEHQRTIKSHIWKHSGHKDVGYPMFQNGPLSIYDDIHGGNKTQELAKMNIIAGGVPVKLPPKPMSQEVKQPVTIKPKTVASSSIPVTTRALMLPKNIQVTQAASLSTASTSHHVTAVALPNSGPVLLSQLLKQQSVVVVPTPGDTIMPEYPFQTISNKESTATVSSDTSISLTAPHVLQDGTQLVVLNVDHSEQVVSDLSNILVVNQEIVEDTDSPPPCMETQVEMKRKQDDVDQNDSYNTDAKRSRIDVNTVVEVLCKNVLVEDVRDSCPDVNLRSSPRVPVIEAESDASSVTSEGRVSVSAGVTIVEPSYDSQDSLNVPSPVDALTQALVSVCEQAERVAVKSVPVDVKHRMVNKANWADDVNSPNLSSSLAKVSSISTRNLRSKNKSGISSSLLAVIEQLRERSKSDSDEEDSDRAPPSPPKVQPASRVTKRSRSKRSSTDEVVDIESYQNVEKLEEESGMYRCKLCHYKSSSTNLMKQHMRLHKSKQPFECSLCDFIAVASEALQDHMLQHCKIRTYQCKLCPSTFNYKSQLRAHMRAHNETDPFTCDVCEFETFNPILFRNHAKTHKEQEKEYHCKECNSVYTEKCMDKDHEKQDFRSDGKLYCDECGLILPSHEDLKKHQKSHIKQLRCEHCTFSCSTLGRMRNHSRLHLDDKPMQCSLCDFTAISTRSLKSHMKRHINDQRYVQQPLEQYKCNLCGYVCHHLPSLKSHMWRHASETGYSYQDANDAINAAIDYENNINQPMKREREDKPSFNEETDDDTDADAENVNIIDHVKETDDNWKVVNVGVPVEGKSDSNTLVTFRCCQCGFESVCRDQLSTHMKQHTDIITKTLEISQYKNYKKGILQEGKGEDAS